MLLSQSHPIPPTPSSISYKTKGIRCKTQFIFFQFWISPINSWPVMNDKGKAVGTFNGEGKFSISSDMMPCTKHSPSSSSSSSSYSSSSGGICAFCLRERLAELICPECGEQRLSSFSCSCSGSCSDPNSNLQTGRISFLLENDRHGLEQNHPKTGESAILKRSNSSCVNNRGVFWKFGRLFRKRRQKNCDDEDFNSNSNSNSNSEMYVSDLVGIPRSRSLCSFRGGGSNPLLYDTEGSRSRSSGLTHSAARVSSVSGGFFMDSSAKRSCFSESEARISNFDLDKDFIIPKGIFAACELSGTQDPKLIHLKLDLSSSTSDMRTEHPVLRRSNEYYGLFKNGDLEKCRKSRKVWRWFFRASSKFSQN